MNIDVEATLNVTELLQLQETMNFFLQVVDPAMPYVVPWCLLDKFNVLVAKYIALHEAAVAPALQQLHVHPGGPPETTEQAHNLGILLRTKLIPELESAERNLRDEIRKGNAANRAAAGDEGGGAWAGAAASWGRGEEETREDAVVERALREANVGTRIADALITLRNSMIQQHDSLCSMAEESLDRHRDALEAADVDEAAERDGAGAG
ncbi:MAG: hypothetical protein BJ554DRAFT_6766, partial [Olpidium bornovanus]